MDAMEKQATSGRYEITTKPAAHARHIYEMATCARYETKSPPQMQRYAGMKRSHLNTPEEADIADEQLGEQDDLANTMCKAEAKEEALGNIGPAGTDDNGDSNK